MKQTFFELLILLIVCFPIVRPLFFEGYFPMHDDTQVGRTVVMGKALLNGQFPVRWVNDLGYGYGYPIFNFYGPLPYYVSGALYSLGFSGLIATKVMMFLGMILPVFTFFFILKKHVGSLSALLGAVMYGFQPYHAVQLYVRGAIGELWILVFFPFLIDSILTRKNFSRSLITGIIGLSGIILSHTLFGFVTAIIYGLFVIALLIQSIFRRSEWFSLLKIGAPLLGGIGCTAFFWLPAIVEMGATNVVGQIGKNAAFQDHFVCLSQLWYSPWGFGGSIPGCIDGLSFSLGKTFVFISMISIFLIFWKIRFHTSEFFVTKVGFLLFMGALFLTTEYSTFLWNSIPQFAYLQYPWRFLSVVSLGIALLGTSIPNSFSHTVFKKVIVISISILILATSSKYFVPQYYYVRSASEFETEEELRFRVSRISDEYLSPEFIPPIAFEEIPKSVLPELTLHTKKTVIDRETYKKYEFTGKEDETIILNQAHFPGWVYKINGKIQPIVLNAGKPVVTITGEFTTLEMIFSNTWSRKVGNAVSTSLMVLLFYIYGKKTFR